VRHAIRTLQKSPTFAVVAILTLAVAIGANAVVFAVVKAVLINPLPYGDPDRLVTIVETDNHTSNPETVSAATFTDISRQSESFEQLSLWGDGSVRLVETDRSDMIRGMVVSANFFDTLGVSMHLGRGFRSGEDRPGREHVLIVTYGMWMERFGGDPRIVGHAISTLDGAYTVVGVLPPQFHPLHMSNPAEFPRVFIPFGYDVGRSSCRGSTCRTLRAIGRLTHGVTIEQARGELAAITYGLGRAYPNVYPGGERMLVASLRDQLVGPFAMALWVLEAAALLLLLLACANVATLLLARTVARHRDTVIRIALGAARWQLIREMLTEAVLVAIAAGIGGVLLAWSATQLIASTANANLPRVAELAPDRSMLFFGIAASLITVVVFGLAPAIIGSRSVPAGLRAGWCATAQPSHTTAIRALIAMELAVSFVLVLAVGLLFKSYLRLTRVDPGFDAHSVLTVSLLPAGISERLAYFDAVVGRTRAIPGVQDAGYASTLPLSHPSTSSLYIRERPLVRNADAPTLDIYLVSANYLAVMKIPVLHGRGFTPQDTESARPVAVVSESAAQSQFRGENAIGQHIKLGRLDEGRPWALIVGVVGDVHQYGLDRKADAAVYVPFAQYPAQGWASLVVRSRIPPERIESALRAAMLAVDPLQPVFHLQPMTTFIELSMAQRTFTLSLIAAFGGLALALAIAGVYGVVSYMTGQRLRELGLRLALGASPASIQRMIHGQVLATAILGIVVGCAALAAFSNALSTMLFEVSPRDGETIAVAVALLVAAALLASYRPIARAARVDPALILRAE
jgi:putative ABC transport system permease protein